jgi:hypothetical protein
VTVKSGAAVCGPEEARKERREELRLDDAYFDSYDDSVFSVDASPALSSFPGKHSLGRDAIGPFGPRKQHPKRSLPAVPSCLPRFVSLDSFGVPNISTSFFASRGQTHLAEAPDPYATTPGADPFCDASAAAAPARLPHNHLHGEDGKSRGNAHDSNRPHSAKAAHATNNNDYDSRASHPSTSSPLTDSDLIFADVVSVMLLLSFLRLTELLCVQALRQQ